MPGPPSPRRGARRQGSGPASAQLPGRLPPAELIQPFSKGGSCGSGLGLAIAAEVATIHGGDLVIDRDAGLTRVRLVLARGSASIVPA